MVHPWLAILLLFLHTLLFVLCCRAGGRRGFKAWVATWLVGIVPVCALVTGIAWLVSGGSLTTGDFRTLLEEEIGCVVGLGLVPLCLAIIGPNVRRGLNSDGLLDVDKLHAKEA